MAMSIFISDTLHFVVSLHSTLRYLRYYALRSAVVENVGLCHATSEQRT